MLASGVQLGGNGVMGLGLGRGLGLRLRLGLGVGLQLFSFLLLLGINSFFYSSLRLSLNFGAPILYRCGLGLGLSEVGWGSQGLRCPIPPPMCEVGWGLGSGLSIAEM